ncbi:hypothetical protein G6F43_003182 [Rhizopus delemar]|nr:hypothetical protein G6F43_003182 [Rhizopus delemar]
MDSFDSDLDQNDKEIYYWEEFHDEAHSEEEPYHWEHPEKTILEEEADEKPYRLTTLGDYFEKQGSELILPKRRVGGRSGKRVLRKKRRSREDCGSKAAHEYPKVNHESQTEESSGDDQGSEGSNEPDTEGQCSKDAKDTFFMPNTVVRLNVGGIPYWVLSDTLIAASFFDRLLNEDSETYNAIVSNQDVFIDRNGRWFEYIHQHLITSQTDFLPSDPSALLCLRDEIRYYGLDTLGKAVDKRIANVRGTLDRPRTWRVLPMIEFEALCKVKRRKVPLMEEYELIGTIETQDAYWVCPRDIYIHSSPSECGKACKKLFDPDLHGWHFNDETKVILASKEEQLSGQ